MDENAEASDGEKMMGNKREIYEALLASETLMHDSKFIAIMNKTGEVANVAGTVPEVNFEPASEWKIYIKPKWYENIPEGGVICNIEGIFGVVRAYDGNRFYENSIEDSGFLVKANPLTKQEIQVFMDNAPEVTDDV